jgi:hypothetical protein
MKIKKNHKIALLDICLPDYFTGYHLPCLAIPIYSTITHKEIAEEIKSELNSTYDYINPDDNKDIERLYDSFILDLKSKGDEIYYECEDISEIEDIEPQYAYFSIINPTFSNGIQFLNP